MECETYRRNAMKWRGLKSSGSRQKQVNGSCEYQDNFGVWIGIYVLAGEEGISSTDLEWRTKTRQKLRSRYDVTYIIFSSELVHSISAVDPGSWEGASGSETYITSSPRFLSCTQMLVVNKWTVWLCRWKRVDGDPFKCRKPFTSRQGTINWRPNFRLPTSFKPKSCPRKRSFNNLRIIKNFLLEIDVMKYNSRQGLTFGRNVMPQTVPWKGRQQVFVTRRYLYTRLHGASHLRIYSSCREIIKSNIRIK